MTRGEGVQNPENFADVLYGWSLFQAPNHLLHGEGARLRDSVVDEHTFVAVRTRVSGRESQFRIEYEDRNHNQEKEDCCGHGSWHGDSRSHYRAGPWDSLCLA